MNDTNRQKIIARTLAGLTAVLGSYLIIAWLIVPFSRNFPPLSSIGDIFFFISFIFVFPVPVLAFGCYCIFTGYHLWFGISSKNIRRISFVAAIAFTFYIDVKTGIMYKNFIYDEFQIPRIMILAGALYLLFKKILLRCFGIDDDTTDWAQREKYVKIFFGLLSLSLWSSMVQLFWGFLPKENADSSIPKDTWDLLSGLVALLLAILIYKLGVTIILWNKPKKINSSNKFVEGTTTTASN